MASPYELRLQDRLAKLQAKQQKFQDRLAANPNAVQAANRNLHVANQILRVQRNQANIGADTPTQLQNQVNFLQGRQQNVQHLIDQGLVNRQRQQALQQRAYRLGQRATKNQNTLDLINNTVPPAPTPPPPGPAVPDTQPDNGYASGATVADLLQQYTPPAAATAGAANNFFIQGLSRLNAMQQPSFQEQYQRWRDLADQESQRQAAAINESFGARGARYGSDLLQAQGDLRRKMATDLAAQSGQINADINNQRLNELQALGGFGANFANLDQQRNNQAMQYLFSDYLRRTNPPPLLAGGAQYASSYGGPTTVVG